MYVSKVSLGKAVPVYFLITSVGNCLLFMPLETEWY